MEAVWSQDFEHGIRAEVVYDTDPHNPADDWDITTISYNSNSRYVLGTEPLNEGEDQAIREKIESGEYIGMPVYAYVHGGATISTSPFSCPWDSGRSGYVYMTREASMEWAKADKKGNLTHTEETLANVRRYLEACVKEFAAYLEGEVYGYRVLDEDGEVLDSCWGYVGDLEYVKSEAVSAAKYEVENAQKEVSEAAYWAARDVVTA